MFLIVIPKKFYYTSHVTILETDESDAGLDDSDDDSDYVPESHSESDEEELDEAMPVAKKGSCPSGMIYILTLDKQLIEFVNANICRWKQNSSFYVGVYLFAWVTFMSWC